MIETPAQMFERIGEELGFTVVHGGMPRGLELRVPQLVNVSADIPYIVYQYDGGTSAVAFTGLRETERAIAYTLWDENIHKAEASESKFYEALLKTKRLVGASQIFSFQDESVARTGIGGQVGGLHGIQREVLIRR